MAIVTLAPNVSVPLTSTSVETPSLEPPGDLLYEVVDGRILELPPMGAYESDIANFLAQLLEEHARKSRFGRVFVELLFRIDVARDLKRRPDVAFVSATRWPYGKRVPRGEAWDMIPNLAVEVVSKSNTGEEILAKLEDYFQTGTELVWVVYPSARQVYVYTSATAVRILAQSTDLDGGDVIPSFHLAVNRLFEDEPDVARADAVRE
jgi:Uma2 family endonuclease